MLNLNERVQSRSLRRTSGRPRISAQAARQEAEYLLRESRLQPLAEHVIRALAVAGVLTADQLDRVCGVKPRTLRKYHSLYYIDRLPILAGELRETRLSDEAKDLRLYKLGLIGEELANSLLDISILTGYSGYGVHRIVHDVLANETVLRLAELAKDHGFEPVWRSKYEATVHDERGAPALEPDAMLSLSKDAKTLHFFIEFHNEDNSRRAALKVDRYEQIYRDGRWLHELLLDEMPVVLCVFISKIAGKGYQHAVARARRMGLQCVFLGKSWEDVVSASQDDMARWWNFAAQRMENILES